MRAGFVGQTGNDLPRRDVNHIACGRICIAPVDAEGDPAGLFANRDARDLFWRHHRRVEHVHAAVGGVAYPDLLFIRCDPDAVTRTAVAFGNALLKTLHLNAMQHLARLQVAHLKAEQIIYICEHQRLAAVDRERTNEVTERPDCTHCFVRVRVCNGKERRLQPGQVNFGA